MHAGVPPSPLGPFCNLGLGGEKDRAEKSSIMRGGLGRAPGGGQEGRAGQGCPIKTIAIYPV